jgi:hypothetical protein
MRSDDGDRAGDDRARASDDRDPAGADPVTPFERSCRLLLRAYPAAYRRERSEEIIGTLLEATPADRSWPRPRDARALLAGGLKARAAQNKRLTTAGNLRVAVMVGVALYLSVWVASYVNSAAIDLAVKSQSAIRWSAWPAVLTAVPIAATVVLAWTAPRLVVLAGALPAAAAVCYFVLVRGQLLGPAVFQLAALVGLVALTPRTTRPSRRWLWLLGAITAAVLLPALGTGYGYLGYFERLTLLAIAVVSFVWIGIDARLTLAVVTYFTLTVMQLEILPFALGPGLSWLFPLLIAAAIAVLALWLLRRQSASTVR